MEYWCQEQLFIVSCFVAQINILKTRISISHKHLLGLFNANRFFKKTNIMARQVISLNFNLVSTGQKIQCLQQFALEFAIAKLLQLPIQCVVHQLIKCSYYTKNFPVKWKLIFCDDGAVRTADWIGRRTSKQIMFICRVMPSKEMDATCRFIFITESSDLAVNTSCDFLSVGKIAERLHKVRIYCFKVRIYCLKGFNCPNLIVPFGLIVKSICSTPASIKRRIIRWSGSSHCAMGD